LEASGTFFRKEYPVNRVNSKWVLMVMAAIIFCTGPFAVGAATLTEEETATLIYMREEEKLAMEVYQSLYLTWNMQVLLNISQAETIHVAATQGMLDKYEIEYTDPGFGLFIDEGLQDDFNYLKEWGETSKIDTLLVGCLIEETDILDLEAAIAGLSPGLTDLQSVYESLKRGSENHLRSFVDDLSKKGVTYVPVLLSQEEFDAIIEANEHAGPYGKGNANKP
jgi:hypothetical protein